MEGIRDEELVFGLDGVEVVMIQKKAWIESLQGLVGSWLGIISRSITYIIHNTMYISYHKLRTC